MKEEDELNSNQEPYHKVASKFYFIGLEEFDD